MSVFFRFVQWFKTTKWGYLMNLLIYWYDYYVYTCIWYILCIYFCIGSTPLRLSNKFEQLYMGHVSRDFAMCSPPNSERVVQIFITRKTGKSSDENSQTVRGYQTVPWRVLFFFWCFSISSHWSSDWRRILSKPSHWMARSTTTGTSIAGFLVDACSLELWSLQVVRSYFLHCGDQLFCCSEPEHQNDICFCFWP